MKKFKNFFLFIITLMMTCVIIFIGYRSLAVAGNYFIMSDNEIKTYPMESDDSYVFYSQSNSEITLFPWNYYADSVSLDELYPNEDDSKTAYLLTDADEFEYLYLQVRYYFYKTIPVSVKEGIISSGSSLYDLINFQDISEKLTARTISNITYYFYNEIIPINGTDYRLSFSFNDLLSIYSFQCRQIVDEDMYSADNMRLGNEYLSNFINSNDQSNLNLILLDIIQDDNYLENYAINYLDADNISLNLSEETMSNYKLEHSKDSYEVYFHLPYQEISNSSYQIVETKDELLLVLADNNIILHFDTISRMFTGFNHMA